MPDDSLDGVFYAKYEDGEWHKVGEVSESVALVPSMDVQTPYHNLPTFSGSITLELMSPWWMRDRMFGLLGMHPRHTVRSLNKGRSWRGRWHRNGKGHE